MSAWLLVWLVIGLVSTAALVACLAFLAYHGILLGRTARRVQVELRPLTDELARESAAVSRRAASLRRPEHGGAGRGRR
jgi:hypothetical protein